MDEATHTAASEYFCAKIAHSAAEFLLEEIDSKPLQYDLANLLNSTASPAELQQFREEFGLVLGRVEMLRRTHEFAGFQGAFCSAHHLRLVELRDALRRLLSADGIEELRSVRKGIADLLRRMSSTAWDHLQTSGTPLTKFVVLLLSDLHWEDKSQNNDWQNVENDFFRSLDDVKRRCEAVDLVLFSGDMVRRGTSSHFESFDHFLNRLWQHIPGNPPLLTVPGNHDLTRPEEADSATHILLGAYPDREEVRQLFWEKSDCDCRKLVGKIFTDYTNWRQRNLDYQRKNENKLKGKYKAGVLPGDFSYVLEKDKRRLGVVGLNSAFLHTKDVDEGRLAIGSLQFNSCFEPSGPLELRNNDVNVLLTHHPVSWLCPQSTSELKQYILHPDLFICHFCGHQHELAYTADGEQPSKTRNHIQAPSLFSKEHYLDGKGQKQERVKHGYNVVEILVHDNFVTARLWPRLFLNGLWKDDDSLFKLEDGWSERLSSANLRK